MSDINAMNKNDTPACRQNQFGKQNENIEKGNKASNSGGCKYTENIIEKSKCYNDKYIETTKKHTRSVRKGRCLTSVAWEQTTRTLKDESIDCAPCENEEGFLPNVCKACAEIEKYLNTDFDTCDPCAELKNFETMHSHECGADETVSKNQTNVLGGGGKGAASSGHPSDVSSGGGKKNLKGHIDDGSCPLGGGECEEDCACFEDDLALPKNDGPYQIDAVCLFDNTCNDLESARSDPSKTKNKKDDKDRSECGEALDDDCLCMDNDEAVCICDDDGTLGDNESSPKGAKGQPKDFKKGKLDSPKIPDFCGQDPKGSASNECSRLKTLFQSKLKEVQESFLARGCGEFPYKCEEFDPLKMGFIPPCDRTTCPEYVDDVFSEKTKDSESLACHKTFGDAPESCKENLDALEMEDNISTISFKHTKREVSALSKAIACLLNRIIELLLGAACTKNREKNDGKSLASAMECSCTDLQKSPEKTKQANNECMVETCEKTTDCFDLMGNRGPTSGTNDPCGLPKQQLPPRSCRCAAEEPKENSLIMDIKQCIAEKQAKTTSGTNDPCALPNEQLPPLCCCCCAAKEPEENSLIGSIKRCIAEKEAKTTSGTSDPCALPNQQLPPRSCRCAVEEPKENSLIGSIKRCIEEKQAREKELETSQLSCTCIQNENQVQKATCQKPTRRSCKCQEQKPCSKVLKKPSKLCISGRQAMKKMVQPPRRTCTCAENEYQMENKKCANIPPKEECPKTTLKCPKEDQISSANQQTTLGSCNCPPVKLLIKDLIELQKQCALGKQGLIGEPCPKIAACSPLQNDERNITSKCPKEEISLPKSPKVVPRPCTCQKEEPRENDLIKAIKRCIENKRVFGEDYVGNDMPLPTRRCPWSEIEPGEQAKNVISSQKDRGSSKCPKADHASTAVSKSFATSNCQSQSSVSKVYQIFTQKSICFEDETSTASKNQGENPPCLSNRAGSSKVGCQSKKSKKKAGPASMSSQPKKVSTSSCSCHQDTWQSQTKTECSYRCQKCKKSENHANRWDKKCKTINTTEIQTSLNWKSQQIQIPTNPNKEKICDMIQQLCKDLQSLLANKKEAACTDSKSHQPKDSCKSNQKCESLNHLESLTRWSIDQQYHLKECQSKEQEHIVHKTTECQSIEHQSFEHHLIELSSSQAPNQNCNDSSPEIEEEESEGLDDLLTLNGICFDNNHLNNQESHSESFSSILRSQMKSLIEQQQNTPFKKSKSPFAKSSSYQELYKQEMKTAIERLQAQLKEEKEKNPCCKKAPALPRPCELQPWFPSNDPENPDGFLNPLAETITSEVVLDAVCFRPPPTAGFSCFASTLTVPYQGPSSSISNQNTCFIQEPNEPSRSLQRSPNSQYVCLAEDIIQPINLNSCSCHNQGPHNSSIISLSLSPPDLLIRPLPCFGNTGPSISDSDAIHMATKYFEATRTIDKTVHNNATITNETFKSLLISKQSCHYTQEPQKSKAAASNFSFDFATEDFLEEPLEDDQNLISPSASVSALSTTCGYPNPDYDSNPLPKGQDTYPINQLRDVKYKCRKNECTYKSLACLCEKNFEVYPIHIQPLPRQASGEDLPPKKSILSNDSTRRKVDSKRDLSLRKAHSSKRDCGSRKDSFTRREHFSRKDQSQSPKNDQDMAKFIQKCNDLAKTKVILSFTTGTAEKQIELSSKTKTNPRNKPIYPICCLCCKTKKLKINSGQCQVKKCHKCGCPLSCCPTKDVTVAKDPGTTSPGDPFHSPFGKVFEDPSRKISGCLCWSEKKIENKADMPTEIKKPKKLKEVDSDLEIEIMMKRLETKLKEYRKQCSKTTPTDCTCHFARELIRVLVPESCRRARTLRKIKERRELRKRKESYEKAENESDVMPTKDYPEKQPMPFHEAKQKSPYEKQSKEPQSIQRSNNQEDKRSFRSNINSEAEISLSNPRPLLAEVQHEKYNAVVRLFAILMVPLLIDVKNSV